MFEGSDKWDDERLAREREYLMEKVNRGEWSPPAEDPAPSPPPSGTPLYRDFAAECLGRWTRRLPDPDGKTAADLEWRLAVGMSVFGPRRLNQIDEALAEDLVDALRTERLAIEHAREQGTPMMEKYVDTRTGRAHERSKRGLSNSSINKALAVAERVMRDAYRRQLVDRVPDLRDVGLKAQAPRRSFLEPVELVAVLAAAEQLEQASRGLTWDDVRMIRGSSSSALALARELRVSDTLVRRIRRGELWSGDPEAPPRNHRPRTAIVTSLALAGPRVSELCGWDGRIVDLADGRLRIPREHTKSDAGERVVPMLPALHEALVAHRAVWPYAGPDPAFTTRTGRRSTPGTILTGVIAPVHERANEILEAQGRPPIGHLTPHTFRRTFASILALCRVDPRRAMYLLGHTDSRFTLRVYQQVLDATPGSLELVEQAMGASREDAREVFESGTVSPALSVGPRDEDPR